MSISHTQQLINNHGLEIAKYIMQGKTILEIRKLLVNQYHLKICPVKEVVDRFYKKRILSNPRS